MTRLQPSFLRTAVVTAGLCVLAGSAIADYSQNFELLFGLPGGFQLTLQDNWYIPAGTTSTDYLVYTYAGNTLGLPQNPTGAAQFAGGTGPGGGRYARAQRDVAFTNEVWCWSYDFCAKFAGTPPAANNVGSFSANPAPNDFIDLMSWVPGQEGTRYRAAYLAYNATGTQDPQPGRIPGAAWDNLALLNWYRATTIINYLTNKIDEVRIKDLSTGVETIAFPTDMYLEGGAAGSTAPCTAVRMFAGGGSAGNSLAFDNIVLAVCAVTAVEPTTWGRIKANFK